jgi:hypothetical protein
VSPIEIHEIVSAARLRLTRDEIAGLPQELHGTPLSIQPSDTLGVWEQDDGVCGIKRYRVLAVMRRRRCVFQIGFWDRKDEIWLIECTDGSRRFRSGNTGRAWGRRLDLTFGDLP